MHSRSKKRNTPRYARRSSSAGPLFVGSLSLHPRMETFLSKVPRLFDPSCREARPTITPLSCEAPIPREQTRLTTDRQSRWTLRAPRLYYPDARLGNIRSPPPVTVIPHVKISLRATREPRDDASSLARPDCRRRETVIVVDKPPTINFNSGTTIHRRLPQLITVHLSVNFDFEGITLGLPTGNDIDTLPYGVRAFAFSFEIHEADPACPSTLVLFSIFPGSVVPTE